MTKTDARLSIREISRRIDVPESTLRYYRNAFPTFIPTLGSGRSRRHPEEAVEVFRVIARLFASGESREGVRARLEGALGPDAAEAGGIEVTGPSVGQLAFDIADAETVEVFEASALRAGQVERLIGSMMMRDRELTQMHRDLLGIVSRLIEVLETRIVTVDAPRAALTQPGPEPRQPAPPRPPAASEGELHTLKEDLQEERETVERLRRAKLELEQRLARLERENKKAAR